jgi:hypothetical protein
MPIFNPSDVPNDRPMDTTRRSGAAKVFKQSVPGFILDEYPLFIDFLEAYYEWLDQSGNPVEFLQNGGRYFDVDTTSEEFLTHFKTAFLDGFPKRLAVDPEGNLLDERKLLKNIREFYKIKGTEKSIRLLFRIIANSETSIEYPREKIFVSSQGSYEDYQLLYVLKDYSTIFNGFDASNVEGLEIQQYEGVVDLIGSATVKSVYETIHNGKEYWSFLVNNVVGNFVETDFQPLLLQQGTTQHQFYPVPAVSDVAVLTGGTDYSVGEIFTIGNTAQEYIKGYVSKTDEYGKIERVRVFSNPVNFTGSDALHIDSPLGTGAALSITQALLTEPISSYRNKKNLLSGESRLQDGLEYQQFSYVINSKRSLEEYIDVIKTIVHPSGFVLFNSLYNNIYAIRPTEYRTRVVAFEYPYLGAYATYGLNSTDYPGNTEGYVPGNISAGDKFVRYGFVFERWSDDGDIFNPNRPPDVPPADPTNGYPANSSMRYEELKAAGTTGLFLPLGTGPLLSEYERQLEGLTLWAQFPHPSQRGVDAPVLEGTQMRDVKLYDLLRMPVVVLEEA